MNNFNLRIQGFKAISGVIDLAVTQDQYNIPSGYFLAQLQDDYVLFDELRNNRPAVVSIIPNDASDVEFTKDWQFYLYAINEGMEINPIISLMGSTKAFMNGTGLGGDEPRNNYLSSEAGKTSYAKNPYTDKFRSMCLNTHYCREDGEYIYPLALDGTQPPPMKPGKTRPQKLSDVRMDDYLITPKNNLPYFVVCTNVAFKPDTRTLDYGPFDHGSIRDFMGDNLPYTFFPFVTSRYKNARTPKNWWHKLNAGERIPSAVRRG